MSKKSKKRTNIAERNVDSASVESKTFKLTLPTIKHILFYLLIDQVVSAVSGSIWGQISKIANTCFMFILNLGFLPLLHHTANKHGWGYVAFSCVGALIPYFIAKHMGKNKRPNETIQIFKMFGVVWCVGWTIVFQLDPLFAVFTIFWIVIGSIMENSYNPVKNHLVKKYHKFLATYLS